MYQASEPSFPKNQPYQRRVLAQHSVAKLLRHCFERLEDRSNINIATLCCAKNRRCELACEQALQGALAAGRKKEGELATTSLEFEFRLQFSCGSPPTELSQT